MDVKDELSTTEARANLSEVVAQVRLLRRCVRLMSRDEPRAALVPVELADAVAAVGGPDAATEILRTHAAEAPRTVGENAVFVEER